MRFNFTDNGDNYSEAVTPVAPLHHVFDADANDSDKSFAVPNGETWQLIFAHLVFATTATPGNRQMVMSVTDADGNEMLSLEAGAVQAASLTRDYHFVQGTYRETAFVANELQVPFGGPFFIPGGWSIRFYDSAAVDAAADDLTVAMQLHRYNGV